ncbi:MAG: hypothetical protein EXR68_05405 [Dehalococcoidia bacterium]|nr:hypothetical protein [Dehalococcoidia bacterium]
MVSVEETQGPRATRAALRPVGFADAFPRSDQSEYCPGFSTGRRGKSLGPKEARRPIWFHGADQSVFFLAGLYESWQPIPDTWQRTFTIITTSPNGLIEPIHDRMPVIVPAEHFDDWLLQGNEPAAMQQLLGPAPDSYLVVSRSCRAAPELGEER